MAASLARVFKKASAATVLALAALSAGCDQPVNNEVERVAAPDVVNVTTSDIATPAAAQAVNPMECRALYKTPHAALQSRKLNDGEAKIVREMFGGTLDPDKITMSAIGDFNHVAFAQPDEIGWRGAEMRDDYSTDKFWRGVFIHELTHLWQFAATPCDLDQKFQYGFTLNDKTVFADLPTEAQADAVAIYAAYYYPPDDVLTFTIDAKLYNVSVTDGVATLQSADDDALRDSALAAHAPQRFLVYNGEGGSNPDPRVLAHVIEAQFPALAVMGAAQEARWQLAEKALLAHMAELTAPKIPAPTQQVVKAGTRPVLPHG